MHLINIKIAKNRKIKDKVGKILVKRMNKIEKSCDHKSNNFGTIILLSLLIFFYALIAAIITVFL